MMLFPDPGSDPKVHAVKRSIGFKPGFTGTGIDDIELLVLCTVTLFNPFTDFYFLVVVMIKNPQACQPQATQSQTQTQKYKE
jgi:hypothetical protein